MILILYYVGLCLSFVGWLGAVIAAFGFSVLWGIFMFLIPFGTPVFYARARQAARPWLILQLLGMAFMVPHYAFEPHGAPMQEVVRDDEREDPEPEEVMVGELTDAHLALLKVGENMAPQGHAALARRERELAVAWHGVLMQRTRLFELLPADVQVNHQEELAAYQLLLNHLDSTRARAATTPSPEPKEN